MPKPDKALIDRITQALVDKGQIIEAGWIGLKMLTIPEDASSTQIEEMRNAFFAGAQHVFGSIMGMLEAGTEPTDKDLRRMSLLNDELNQFLEQFKRQKGISDYGSH